MTCFKEYKKKSITDNRQTFEAAVLEKMDYYNTQINNGNSLLNDEHIEYLLDIMPMCHDYYNDDKVEKENTVDEYKDYRDYQKDIINNAENDSQMVVGPNNIQHYISTENTKSKGLIYKQYREYMQQSQITEYNNIYNTCTKCKCNLMIDYTESTVICPECGISQTIMDACEDGPNVTLTPGTAERLEMTPYYAYKRSNHFNEWLHQLQAKESTNINQEIYDKILMELKKERVVNPEDITHDKVRRYLKKLKLNKYYEHIPHILLKLKGTEPYVISREIEQQLRYMFQLIQAPFAIHCPKNRKNFLSYSYTLYKMAEILGEDDLLKNFSLPLLKSREKLIVQDKIWKGICSELDWEFIATI